MSVLVVGLSHASSPLETLERAVISSDAQLKLLHDVRTSDQVAGSLVLSTCNRVEVYAEVETFHGGVATICELLARHSGLPTGELAKSAYVHYEDRAAAHLLAVTCGLESIVVGESQILGQVRQAVRLARQHGTLSRELSDLSRLALRTGKRARSETGIDAAGQNLVTLGLDIAARQLTKQPSSAMPLGDFSVLVVGAGSMSSLAVATSARQGAARIVVANRTRSRAEHLASRYGAQAAGLADLPADIAEADLVIAATGASWHVLTEAIVAQALTRRRPRKRPLVIVDLGLPRNVEARVASLQGVHVIDLAEMGAFTTTGNAGLAPGGGHVGAGPTAGPTAETSPGHTFAGDSEVAAVRRIIAQELAGYLKASRAATVAPTVVALRAKAATVVESELARLERRLADLDPAARREIAQSMGRIADKLLHGPTVRVKELAGSPGAESYETALRVLFELDQDTVQSVGRPDVDLLASPDQGTAE